MWFTIETPLPPASCEEQLLAALAGNRVVAGPFLRLQHGLEGTVRGGSFRLTPRGTFLPPIPFFAGPLPRLTLSGAIVSDPAGSIVRGRVIDASASRTAGRVVALAAMVLLVWSVAGTLYQWISGAFPGSLLMFPPAATAVGIMNRGVFAILDRWQQADTDELIAWVAVVLEAGAIRYQGSRSRVWWFVP